MAVRYFVHDEDRPQADRSEYMRAYYLQNRKSVRKKPVMTEEERRKAQRGYERKHREKIKQLWASVGR